MSDKKYQTIVIEYEGDEPPMKGFCTPVLGCEVVRIAMCDEIQKANELDNLLSEVEIILGEDSEELSDIAGEINQGMEIIIQAKNRLLAIYNEN